MAGKICLVTGATDGIGKATARRLLQGGATVIAHGRNQAKLSQTVQELGAAGDVHAALADFADLDAVARLASDVLERFGRLDVLVNNAGLLTDHRQLSSNGYELTFAVNYLAPFLLTQLLLARLTQSAPARIVNVASTAMGGGNLGFDDLQAQQSFDGWQAYANSKLANVLFSNVLAERVAGTGVVCNALCPGLIDTHFFHTNTVFANGAYERMQPGMRTPDEGADIPVWLATAAETADLNGRFVVRYPRYGGVAGYRPYDVPWDREMACRLWDISLSMVAPWLSSVDS